MKVAMPMSRGLAGGGLCSSPRHRVKFNSRNEGLKCVPDDVASIIVTVSTDEHKGVGDRQHCLV